MNITYIVTFRLSTQKGDYAKRREQLNEILENYNYQPFISEKNDNTSTTSTLIVHIPNVTASSDDLSYEVEQCIAPQDDLLDELKKFAENSHHKKYQDSLLCLKFIDGIFDSGLKMEEGNEPNDIENLCDL